MKYTQTIFGLLALLVLLLTAYFGLSSIDLFYRLLIGLAFGYTFSRAAIGFAGGVNKLNRTGSASVAKAIMLLFIATALFTALFLYQDPLAYHLKITPINLALILGGLLFGIGMTFSSCCATGSLMDLSSGFSRALISIIFLSIGVFLGFSTQSSSFVQTSYLSSSTGLASKGGVFLPDLFVYDGFNGFLGAFTVTLLLSLLFIKLAKKYEKNYFKKRDKEVPQEFMAKSQNNFERIFVTPWPRPIAVVIIALLFASLLFLFKEGWGASTAFGLWFAKFLMLFGFSADTLAQFTHKSIAFISTPLTQHPTSIQNFGIILGSVFYLLLSGGFKKKFPLGLNINKKDFMLFALGGLLMGYGTRLSNGCNVGALYTPISEFSLSGWIYLIAIVSGGFLGNFILKNYIYKK